MRKLIALAIFIGGLMSGPSVYAQASNTSFPATGFIGGTITAPILYADGTVGAPSFAFSSDADGSGTGFYRAGANSIGVSINGNQTMQFNASTFALLNSASFQMTSGSGTTYLRSVGSEILGIGASGAGLIYAGNGAVGAPSYSFTNATTTGFYTPGSSDIVVSTGGTGRAYFSSAGAQLASTLQFAFSSGSVGAASDVGFARLSAGVIKVTDGSSNWGSLNFHTNAQITGTTNALIFNLNAVSNLVLGDGSVTAKGSSTYGWAAASPTGGSADTGLARDSAGTVRVTDGSSGSGSLRATAYATPGTGTRSVIVSTGVKVGFGYDVGWASTGDAAGSIDSALTRSAAGVIKVTDGSTGIRGLLGGGSTVASATALPVPTGSVFHVSGTTTITSITSTNFASGAIITIIFDGILTFTDGSNLKLAGNFVTSADDTITLAYDGTNWYEMARAVN